MDAGDLDLQAAAIASGEHPVEFDLDGNGSVDTADRTLWVDQLKYSWIGDANLDGEFNSSDMVQVFTVGKYETDEGAGWAEGDWDGNQRFDSSDMVLAFQNGGYERGQRPAAKAVPEPDGMLFLIPAMLFFCRRLRGQRRVGFTCAVAAM